MRNFRNARFLPAILVLPLLAAAVRADDWPQWLGPQRDGIWREKGILETFPEGGLKERWRVSVGAGYSGPAVAEGRVYLTDRVKPDGTKLVGTFPGGPTKERVLCLDEKT